MPSRDIQDAAQPIRSVWENIKNDFIEKSPGHYLELTTVHRTPAEQFELFKKGRTMGTDGKWVIQDKTQVVTNVDGTTILGSHNYHPARAIDVAVVDNQSGKFLWDDKYYQPLGDIAKRYNLEWGGDWKSFKDMPHIEIPDYKNYKGK